MARRKILYVVTKGTWGGAQRYVFDLATGLPRDEFEAVVAHGEGEALPVKLSGARIRSVRMTKMRRDIGPLDAAAFAELFRVIRKEAPDIVHLNSSKAAGFGALAARIAGVPRIVFTAHGWPFKEDRSALVRMLVYAATWLTVLLSHRTIVVSREDEALGKRMWFVSGKISYIPLALRAESKMLDRQTAEKILFVPEPNVDLHIINSIRLVTIAELTKNKGLHYGIDMMRELERQFPGKYTYTIFGEGEELPALQSETSGLLNRERLPIVLFRSILFRNALTQKQPLNVSTDASLFLKAFDIFVLPSIKEGMPYVLLEAATAGLPIVATDIVREEAANLPNIHFVPPRDGHAIARAVQHLQKHPPIEMSVGVRSFQTILQQTLALYDRRWSS
jgi:glycosyltransferase involved in cell wall biosynthesis